MSHTGCFGRNSLLCPTFCNSQISPEELLSASYYTSDVVFSLYPSICHCFVVDGQPKTEMYRPPTQNSARHLTLTQKHLHLDQQHHQIV